MDSQHMTQLIDWLRRSLFLRLQVSFEKPARIETADHVRIWFEDWARAIAEFSQDQDLIDAAWRRVVKTYRGREWPVAAVVVKAMEDLIPERLDVRRTTTAREDGKTAKGCADFLTANMHHHIDDWWRDNSAWVDAKMAEHMVAEQRQGVIRRAVAQIVRDAAHYHCQCLYWGNKAPPFDLSSPGFDPYNLRLTHVWKLKPTEKAA